MFSKLFASGGLTLDRMRSFLEVAAAGSIAKAARGEPARQSQYSRQIKELEDFFGVPLVERHGKGLRLTANGRELTRLARFFLLGLSNFQRGCRAEKQSIRIGASATFIQSFLVDALIQSAFLTGKFCFSIERATDYEIERRLHDLTLDFGIVTARALSRPLAQQKLGEWRWQWCVPKALPRTVIQARAALREKRVPIVIAQSETDLAWDDLDPAMLCDDCVTAQQVLRSGHAAALLPSFMMNDAANETLQFDAADSERAYYLAWNPRLLRLNAGMSRLRDSLAKTLATAMANQCRKR